MKSTLKQNMVGMDNDCSWLTDEAAVVLKPKAMKEFAANWEDHVDPKTGELNTTTLVEDVVDQRGWFVTSSVVEASIPDDFFDWAFEFEENLEVQT